MERKTPIVEGEYYHLYTRGVERRDIFTRAADYERFMFLLLVANQESAVSIREIERRYRGEPSASIYQAAAPSNTLTDVLAYALMPNHLHIIAHERVAGGISRFMLKLMTGYSMYFNTRYERSGPLFTRPYRSKHLHSDEYVQTAVTYVHANPLDLLQSDWKTAGVPDELAALRFLNDYRYSSYGDRAVDARPESRILAHEARGRILDAMTLSDIPVLRANAAAYEHAPAIL